MSATLNVVENIKGVITKKGATISDAVKAVKNAAAATSAPATPIPGSPALSAEVEQNMKALPALLASLELPEVRRQLTADEREALLDAYVQLKAVIKGLDDSAGEMKAAAFNHFDAAALATDADLSLAPRTKEGWFVVEDKTSFAIEGQDKTLTREVRNGSVSLTEADVAQLEQDGQIDHKTYLRWTQQVRVINEDAIMADLKKTPQLIMAVARAAKVGAASASLNVRNAKQKK